MGATSRKLKTNTMCVTEREWTRMSRTNYGWIYGVCVCGI